ncbi:uncharacterized protein N7484_005143 [Penicillium longicatenatum]|uniref:uncharacterized protein n=1 Tax=Penicillium longicatenatum TaxID=1561947 RepID=UPI0025495B6D|nr:uncharacterized protein N7484_005143 [Penicillium longicatenatum]KAJ5651420.1 hypothetical protein N7484_005143 [Penicillium longicatenatum]
MGRSEPPFLYDRPSAYSFNGPTDPFFNPKAVTQASRTPAVPRQKQDGPLINFNRHPDSWESFEKKPTHTPMNPKVKKWIKGVRGTQLGLRSITLLGALASLFCSIVIKNADTTVIWIMRSGPIVAILHTLYGVYHFCRSPVTRPPASQASYGVFAGTLDAGLIPFYVFTAYVAHADYANDAYSWGTLFKDSEITLDIVEATFICALVNTGLHLISFCLSIFLAVIFRKISHLPPDMNPLEDNLTARPRRSFRKEIDVDEKHMSSSTLHSNMEDPLMGSPRTVPFIHTREDSFGGETIRGSVDMSNEKRQSQIFVQPHRFSLEPPSPERYYHNPSDEPYNVATATTAPEYHNVPARSPNIVDPSIHTRHLASRTADRSESVSPMSDNWVAHDERYPSPVSDVQGQGTQNNDTTLRQSSSVYSRRTDRSAPSAGSGIRDWFAYPQRNQANVGSVIHEDTRGEYASLAVHEYYGNEGNDEQDIGAQQRFNIFPDPEEHDHDNDDEPSSIPFNPLMLNPPTPQPVLTEKQEDTDPVRRNALGDNPNLSQNQKAQVFTPHQNPDSPTFKNRFYGELEDNNPGLSIAPRHVSAEEDVKRKPSKLTKKRSKKLSAYQSLKKDDSDDEGYLSARVPSSPAMAEGDRKGRVVSNSGADTARPGLVGGVGASLSSYGNYIAGLGVGRRRDVSGKVAEEGRGGKSVEVHPSPSAVPSPNQTPDGKIRAAGWARFAGL